jgi:hypothetical protein
LIVGLLFNIAIGGIARALAAVNVPGNQISKDTLITFVTTRYSGTDLLEGFIRR